MQPLVFVLLFYNGSEEEGRARFKPFFDLSKLFFDSSTFMITSKTLLLIEHIIDLTKQIPYEELNAPQVCDVVSNISNSLATDPTTLECWSRTGPSSQRHIPHQTSFRLSQEGTRSISFLGQLRNPNNRPPGIFSFQEDPEHSQWYLRIPKTQVQ